MRRRKVFSLVFVMLLILVAAFLMARSAFPKASSQETPTAGKEEWSAALEGEVEKATSFDMGMVPEYTGDASVAINGNVPFFTEEDLKTTGETYAELDRLGRCGVCIALVGQETLPTASREPLGEIKPTGWDNVKYAGIDGNFLYNRCHLIGWQLTGENANPNNLITGTRYMNTQGMEPIESRVAKYVRDTGHHVLYRSTPIFEGNNLLASGVLIEAKSLEDDQILLNVYCYNVQPDVTIDYATGSSNGPEFLGTETADHQKAEISRQSEPSEEEQSATYIGNKSSYKFHRPGCESLSDMAEHNKVFFHGTRDEVLEAGYQPCKNCKP